MENNWDFYFCTIENKPASVFVDLNLINTPEVFETKNHILKVFVKLNDPENNGLARSSETDILFALEESLDKVLLNENILKTGRVTFDGWKTFVYYFSEYNDVEKKINDFFNNYKNYAYDIEIEEDPDTELYYEFLYPDNKSIQHIENRNMLEYIENHVHEPNMIDKTHHHFSFYFEENVKKFFNILDTKEYVYDKSFVKESDLLIRCEVHVQSKLSEIDLLTDLFIDLASDFDGEYDGWEAKIV